jgi:hypothetical protein
MAVSEFLGAGPYLVIVTLVWARVRQAEGTHRIGIRNTVPLLPAPSCIARSPSLFVLPYN